MKTPDDSIKGALGQVHVYTGESKGKTTACIGLAVRAAGHGLKTYIGQFMKGRHYGELDTIRSRLSDYIEIEQYGREEFCCLDGPPKDIDYELALGGLERAREKLHSGRYNIVILDEANVAAAFGLVMVSELVDLIENKPKDVELVLTGRWVHPKIVEAADLVTEMKVVKHYFEKGVMARKGIEE